MLLIENNRVFLRSYDSYLLSRLCVNLILGDEKFETQIWFYVKLLKNLLTLTNLVQVTIRIFVFWKNLKDLDVNNDRVNKIDFHWNKKNLVCVCRYNRKGLFLLTTGQQCQTRYTKIVRWLHLLAYCFLKKFGCDAHIVLSTVEEIVMQIRLEEWEKKYTWLNYVDILCIPVYDFW